MLEDVSELLKDQFLPDVARHFFGKNYATVRGSCHLADLVQNDCLDLVAVHAFRCRDKPLVWNASPVIIIVVFAGCNTKNETFQFFDARDRVPSVGVAAFVDFGVGLTEVQIGLVPCPTFTDKLFGVAGCRYPNRLSRDSFHELCYVNRVSLARHILDCRQDILLGF